MDVRPEGTSPAVSFLFVFVGLLALAAGLIAMLVITTRAAIAVGDAATRKLLARLAWMSLALLCLTVVLLLWALLRHVRYRLRAAPPLKPSKYVNAWELAGQRFQLDEDDEDDDGDEPGDRPRPDDRGDA